MDRDTDRCTHMRAHTHTHTHLCLVKAKDVAGQSCTNIALGGLGVMQEPELQWNHALWSEVNALDDLVFLPVPHVEVMAVHACRQGRGALGLEPGSGSDVRTLFSTHACIHHVFSGMDDTAYLV